MYVIGVDPGKNGAAAYIDNGMLMGVLPFNGDINQCRRIGVGAENKHATYFIERVSASPHMGVVSAFTFGKWAEAVECTARLPGRDVPMIKPAVWQHAVGIFSQGTKKALYAHAKGLYPQEHINKMFNLASADAVLIAYYGWRYMENQSCPS